METYAVLDVSKDLGEAFAQPLDLGTLLDEFLLHPNVLGVDLGVAPSLALAADSNGRLGAERKAAVVVVGPSEARRTTLDSLPQLLTAELEPITPLALLPQVLQELLLALLPSLTIFVERPLDLFQPGLPSRLPGLHGVDELSHAAHLPEELALADPSVLLDALELADDLFVAFLESFVLGPDFVEASCGAASFEFCRVELGLEGGELLEGFAAGGGGLAAEDGELGGEVLLGGSEGGDGRVGGLEAEEGGARGGGSFEEGGFESRVRGLEARVEGAKRRDLG